MNVKIAAKGFFIFSAAVFLGLTGCSTPESRAKERPEAFNKLSDKQRTAALEGELIEGMSKDAVYVALGKPSRMLQSREKGVERERWIYTQLENQEIPSWRSVYRQQTEGSVSSHIEYEPIYIQRPRDSFEVIFEKGRVTGWRDL